MASVRILIVDDELAIRQVIASNLKKEGYAVEDVGSGEEAIIKLNNGDFDIVICDIKMSGMNGIDVMRKAQESGIDSTFLLMTAFASVDTVIEGMKLGAFDYLIKPVRTEELLHQLSQITDMRGLRTENRILRNIVLGEHCNRCALSSPVMLEIERIVTKVAVTDSTVLITGESGTGKGVIARNIQQQSLRAGAPFIPINCGAIPENLLESELFGHMKGSFTGADRTTRGLFSEADKGTIFLDEIGELPLQLQVKLLHVIEDQEIRAIGSETNTRIDVRIISATNRNLTKMVEAGEFREDLYFRLNIINIEIPPLRERRMDIQDLIQFFMIQNANQYAAGRNFSIDPQAETMLLNYDWHGNVRELENVITRALILCESEQITVADLPVQITNGETSENLNFAVTVGGSLRDKVRAYEYNMIQQAIKRASGDRRVAAENLGIGTSTLYRKIDDYEMTKTSD